MGRGGVHYEGFTNKENRQLSLVKKYMLFYFQKVKKLKKIKNIFKKLLIFLHT